MTDFFSLLSQPRNPWLDPDRVKEAFVAAAAELHPDRIHEAPEQARREAQDRYTQLNEAHLCLKDTRARIRHLLELERGRKVKDLQEIPDDVMQLFEVVGQQLRSADAHCRNLADIDSPLLKVALLEQGEELRVSLQQTQSSLQTRRDGLNDRLRSLDGEWNELQAADLPRREAILAELEAVYRLMSFYERWFNQAQARIMRLMEHLFEVR